MKISKYLLISLLGLSLSACSLPGFDFGDTSNTPSGNTPNSTSQNPDVNQGSNEDVNTKYDFYDLANKVITTRKYEVDVVMGPTTVGHFSYFAQDGDNYHIQQTFPAENSITDYYCSFDGTYLYVTQKINGEVAMNYTCVEGDGYFEWVGGTYIKDNGIIMTGMPATIDFFPLIEIKGLTKVDDHYTFTNTTFGANGETIVEVGVNKFGLFFYDASADADCSYTFHNIGTLDLYF